MRWITYKQLERRASNKSLSAEEYIKRGLQPFLVHENNLFPCIKKFRYNSNIQQSSHSIHEKIKVNILNTTPRDLFFFSKVRDVLRRFVTDVNELNKDENITIPIPATGIEGLAVYLIQRSLKQANEFTITLSTNDIVTLNELQKQYEDDVTQKFDELKSQYTENKPKPIKEYYPDPNIIFIENEVKKIENSLDKHRKERCPDTVPRGRRVASKPEDGIFIYLLYITIKLMVVKVLIYSRYMQLRLICD